MRDFVAGAMGNYDEVKTFKSTSSALAFAAKSFELLPASNRIFLAEYSIRTEKP